MAQTVLERTSIILPVPFHGSVDQVLGDDETAKIFDMDTIASRGQFKSGAVVAVTLENLDEIVDITSVTFKDSKDGVTFVAVTSGALLPAAPIVKLGRATATVVMRSNARYLQVLARHGGGTTYKAQMRIMLSQLSGGHPLT